MVVCSFSPILIVPRLNKQKQDEHSVSPLVHCPHIGTVKLKLDKFILNSVTVKVAYNCFPFGHQQLAVCEFHQNEKYQNLSAQECTISVSCLTLS